jgi:uncharacterized protein YigE (DUF2233 family)
MISRLCWCVLCISLLPGTAKAQGSWVTLRPGLEIFNGSFDDHGQEVSFALVRCDPKRKRLRIVDTFHSLGKTNAFAAFSVREVSKKTRATVVVNAGSTATFSLPVPVGLLQVGGNIVSQTNHLAEHSGILCIGQDHVTIVPVSPAAEPDCIDAVQRGPYLTRDSVSVVDATHRSRRTAVAVDRYGRLLILVTKDRATEWAINAFLYASKLGLNTETALNLDGDVSSGMTVAIGKMKTEIGNIDGLVASALAIDPAN